MFGIPTSIKNEQCELQNKFYNSESEMQSMLSGGSSLLENVRQRHLTIKDTTFQSTKDNHWEFCGNPDLQREQTY